MKQKKVEVNDFFKLQSIYKFRRWRPNNTYLHRSSKNTYL